MAEPLTPEIMNGWNKGGLPHMLGIAVTACEPGRVAGCLPVKPELIAGNGALWAPAIVALAAGSLRSCMMAARISGSATS